MSYDYDLIVVGAGSGGSVVAARLSEDPRIRVLLIESGPDYPNLEALPEDLRNVNHGSFFDHDWGLRYRPSRTSRTVAFPRGRVVGGSSAVNTAIALRGSHSDYDEWAALGNPRWSWEQVLPAFIRLETDLDFGGPLHGTTGPIPIRRHPREELVPYQAAFLDGCAELGYPARPDHNDHTTTGYGPHPMNKRGTLRISTAIAYLAAARERPNLRISAETDVRRVVFRDGNVAGVEVRRGGTIETITAPNVVLACGAIHTPAVLVRSGIGPADVLDRLGVAVTRALDGVGQHLQDHPAIGPTLVPKPGVASWDDPVIQTTLYYTSAGGGDWNDMQIEPLSFMHIPGAGELLLGLAACVFKSYSYGRLEFESADVDAKPRIAMDYLSDERDYLKLREGLGRAVAVCHTRAVRAVHDGIRRPTDAELSDEAALEAWIRRNCATGAHPSCTARMGPADDPTAVVDDLGRVHGVHGLRIADASIMPRVPSANTNIPTIMIGERIAEFLRDDLA
ncbi:MAG TPA: GMC family oxidoreductase N-terminal domain-containing protein [Dehalococcoidia bacterium]|nr:GMC family oxidoreductase N-terminal domain-containing protein [Dehalococcoidia bacterium]